MSKAKEPVLQARAAELEAFLKGQLTEARERFTEGKAEAEKVLKGLIGRIDPSGLSRRAESASADLRKSLDQIQNRVVEAAGVASQAQIREITRELGRISKKVDALAGKKNGKSPARA